MAETSIEWATKVWNPVVGCSVISPGCTNCYAMRMAGRLERMGSPIYKGLTQKTKAGDVWTGKVEESNWGKMIEPLGWRKPQRVFVNSMSDLFHENLPDKTIDKVFAVMALCPQHTFMVLTKRAGRMREYLTARNGMGNAALCRAINDIPFGLGNRHGALQMPLPNCWLGVSTENQATADERVPDLLATPAAVRFVSAEPLLSEIDFAKWADRTEAGRFHAEPILDMIIAGSESGPRARPCDVEWVRSIKNQCVSAGVAFFYKQAATAKGKKIPLPELDGRTWDQFPEVNL